MPSKKLKRRPAISFRADTIARLDYAAFINGQCRGNLAEQIVREYLDGLGVPKDPPKVERVKRKRRVRAERPLMDHKVDESALGGVHFF